MLDLLPVRHVEGHPEQLNNYVGLWYMNTFTEKEKLKKNLTNLYGQYLENRQINTLVRNYHKSKNAVDIKARAYKIAYQKYMLQMTNFGTSLVNKFPKAPRCPSGVKPFTAGGFGVGGAMGVAGRGAVGVGTRAVRAAARTVAQPFQGGGNPAKNANSAKNAAKNANSAKSDINRMNLRPNNKKMLKNQINKGNKPEKILRNARALARTRRKYPITDA